MTLRRVHVGGHKIQRMTLIGSDTPTIQVALAQAQLETTPQELARVGQGHSDGGSMKC